MSASALGDSAVCGKLVADEVQSAVQRITIGDNIGATSALPTTGLHFIFPPTNPSAYTLGVGEAKGDVVEFVHVGGTNVADIAITALHGTSTSASLQEGTASIRLVWNGVEWYILGRSSNNAAAANAVANLPVIA
jgi:hypothetical protein